MKKYIHNETNSSITLMGTKISANNFVQLDELKHLKSANDEKVVNAILESTVVMSLDGTNKLSKEDSLLLNSYRTDSKNLFFESNDLRNNKFSSVNAQEAIEEAGGRSRYVIQLMHNGRVGDNTYIGYQNTLPAHKSPVMIPKGGILKEITISNTATSADFDIEIKKDSIGSDSIKTFSHINQQTQLIENVDLLLNSGDLLFLKYKDYGTNAKDLVIQLSIQV